MNDPNTHHLTAGDGSLDIAVRGARVLSCRVDGHDDNLFYDDGNGSGGDRLWIAPEVAYYWPSLDDARRDPVGTAATPPQVDPGDWSVLDTPPAGVTLRNAATLTDGRDGKSISLDMVRTVDSLDRPHGLPDTLRCVSFGITNGLLVTGGDEGAVAAAWDILQVPPTGTLICPVTRRVEPRSYYDPFGGRHVVCDDTAVRFLIDAKRRIKMGLRPEHTTGRMGYYRPPAPGSDGRSSLIVRVFPVYPGERYVDIPRDHPIDQRTGGDALQAYNDDLTFGPFGEMEFVAPAVAVGGTTYRSTLSVTQALVGPDDAIHEAGRALLGVEVGMIG